MLITHLTFLDDELVTLLNDIYIFQNHSLVYFNIPFNLLEITPCVFGVTPFYEPLSWSFDMNPYMFRFPLIILHDRLGRPHYCIKWSVNLLRRSAGSFVTSYTFYYDPLTFLRRHPSFFR